MSITKSRKGPVAVQPPVPVHGTEGRYAAALYMAGKRANKLDQVAKDLEEVSLAISANRFSGKVCSC